MNPNTYLYHLETTLATLEKLEPPPGDTRMYLDLDRGERDIMMGLIQDRLEIMRKQCCGE